MDSDRKSHSEPARRTPCTSCGKTRMMKRGQAIHWGQPGKKTIVYNMFVYYIYIYVCVYTYITLHYTTLHLHFHLHLHLHYIHIYIYIYYSVCTVISVNGRYQRDPLYGRCGFGSLKVDEILTRPGKPTKKRWKIAIFHGKTMENHHLSWENDGKSPFFMGKLWKITIFHGKTMENHHF